MIQEITLGLSSGLDGVNTSDEDLKILVRPVSDDLTEVSTLSRSQIENKTSREVRGEGGWRVTACLVVPFNFTHRRLVKLLLSMVASHLKSGYSLIGNYVYEDRDPVEMRRRKTPGSNQLKGHTSTLTTVALAAFTRRSYSFVRLDGLLGVYEVAQHFHRPINEASKFLNICPTVLKKICRKAGLPRWPHRKLQSIHRELDKLRTLLNDNTQTEEQIQGLQGRISHLERERRHICFEE